LNVALERRKKIYRRTRGTDGWHFIPQCADWPTWNFKESSAPLTGHLCPECLVLQPVKAPNRRKSDPKKNRK
jgi:hypothetical protein